MPKATFVHGSQSENHIGLAKLSVPHACLMGSKILEIGYDSLLNKKPPVFLVRHPHNSIMQSQCFDPSQKTNYLV
jgi:hypothetical protein